MLVDPGNRNGGTRNGENKNSVMTNQFDMTCIHKKNVEWRTIRRHSLFNLVVFKVQDERLDCSKSGGNSSRQLVGSKFH